MSLAEKQGEVYGRILGFLWPPRPMTLQEWGEWWEAERAPIIRASMVTAEDFAASFVAIANAANPAQSERERGPMIPED